MGNVSSRIMPHISEGQTLLKENTNHWKNVVIHLEVMYYYRKRKKNEQNKSSYLSVPSQLQSGLMLGLGGLALRLLDILQFLKKI